MQAVRVAGSSLRRGERFEDLRFLWSWSSLDRVRACYRCRVDASGGVVASITPDGVGTVTGVQHCGSVWACPVCAPKVRQGRADEIRSGVGAHLEDGGSVEFVTLTVPHERRMRLAMSWDVVAGAWRRVVQSRAWRRWKDDYGIVGTIRAIEQTHGANGWHPHLHNLILFSGELSEWHREMFRSELAAEWNAAVLALGYKRPSDAHGVRWETVASIDGLASYLAEFDDGGRVDLEVARPDLKHGRNGGRSPWQILRDARTLADKADLALWWEFEGASHGRQSITWSKGLKGLLGVDVVSDEALAEAEVEGTAVVELQGGAWLSVCRSSGGVRSFMAALESGRVALSLHLHEVGISSDLVVWPD